MCGYAPRQRLDLSVNILTNHAINNGKITVFGGSQMRPNLHIQDMCDAVQAAARRRRTRRSPAQTFNAGYQNMSIMEIAQLVQARGAARSFRTKATSTIVTTPTDDIRSYHINSDKITRVLGFTPKHTIEDAVRDLCQAFKAGKLPEQHGRRHLLQRPAA